MGSYLLKILIQQLVRSVNDVFYDIAYQNIINSIDLMLSLTIEIYRQLQKLLPEITVKMINYRILLIKEF